MHYLSICLFMTWRKQTFHEMCCIRGLSLNRPKTFCLFSALQRSDQVLANAVLCMPPWHWYTNKWMKCIGRWCSKGGGFDVSLFSSFFLLSLSFLRPSGLTHVFHPPTFYLTYVLALFLSFCNPQTHSCVLSPFFPSFSPLLVRILAPFPWS